MNTNEFIKLSKERQYNSLRRTCKKLGYYFYEGGDYNINIIAIRNVDTLQSTKFNDFVAVAYLVDGIKQVDLFKATTDPGKTYRTTPINSNGTAIVLPQQVVGGLRIGTHKGYKALVQNQPFNVIRDNDRNDLLSELSQYTMGEIRDSFTLTAVSPYNTIVYDGYGRKVTEIESCKCGINFHRASKWKILEYVGLYSAGCIVQQNAKLFKNKFMKLVDKSASIYGDKFTMTLLTNIKLH